MTRFRDEIKVIPPLAWALAICFFVGFAAFAWFEMIPHDAEGHYMPVWFAAMFMFVLPLFASSYILLVGYVSRDARRRGMRHVMWTLLAIFIPNAIGIILYFIVREPLLMPCPSCATMVSHGAAFCSKCGAALGRACPECRSAVQPEWSHCTKCGAKLAA